MPHDQWQIKAAQSDGRREKKHQLTSVVEANFQGLVTAERSVSQLSGAGSRTQRRGYKITASEVGFLG